MEATKPGEAFVYGVQDTVGPSPTVFFEDPATRKPIKTLARAKELAEAVRVHGGGWDAVTAYYGILKQVP